MTEKARRGVEQCRDVLKRLEAMAKYQNFAVDRKTIDDAITIIKTLLAQVDKP